LHPYLIARADILKSPRVANKNIVTSCIGLSGGQTRKVALRPKPRIVEPRSYDRNRAMRTGRIVVATTGNVCCGDSRRCLGIIGLFVGPVMLAVTYTLLREWINEQGD
jgi:hypothetical protein